MGIELLKQIIDNPIPYAHSLGFTKLREDIHKDWIRSLLFMNGSKTLQAHRGSYKTSCLIVSMNIWCISKPSENLIFLRKSHEDVKDVLGAVSKSLKTDVSMNLMKDIYGRFPKFVTDSTTELELDTYKGAMGRQILGLGLKSSITGKHGPVVTDDIVTLKDRLSEAERKTTKAQYMELVNIASEENHFIMNYGTPWHKDDAFSLMPKASRFTVYETGILSPETIAYRKANMSPSLFAANYELKHIADGDVLFHEPVYGKFPIGSTAYAHIDAAYGGEDASALTIIAQVDNTLFTVGWKMPGHIDTHYKEIISRLERFQAVECWMEDNADKGYLKKELSQMCDVRFKGYHESMNKYYKISTHGLKGWKRVVVDMEQSDLDYIADIMDYNENSEHDDCPDSFSSLVRQKFKTNRKRVNLSTRI